MTSTPTSRANPAPCNVRYGIRAVKLIDVKKAVLNMTNGNNEGLTPHHIFSSGMTISDITYNKMVWAQAHYPILWNALDLDIRLLPFDTFKKSVKTHLYLKYFVN